MSAYIRKKSGILPGGEENYKGNGGGHLTVTWWPGLFLGATLGAWGSGSPPAACFGLPVTKGKLELGGRKLTSPEQEPLGNKGLESITSLLEGFHSTAVVPQAMISWSVCCWSLGLASRGKPLQM